jgi:hypothetical protein
LSSLIAESNAAAKISEATVDSVVDVVEELLITDESVVPVFEMTSTSAEQIYRVQGDLGEFSVMGQRIGISGVGQLSTI